jgi:glyoxylase-like metal-dependent hydrolase (beta-lactamase superfamily II)
MLAVKQNNANLKYLLHTHGHYDHIIGDYDLKTKAGVKIFLHKEDKQLADKFHEQLMMFGAGGAKSPSIDEYIQDNQIIELGELKFKVIHTPGHTPGGVCYLIEDALFSGDTLFEECIGRTDFPGGSFEQLRNSIVNKLFTLKENIKVYPGHGPSTTIAHEKEFNPYFGTKATSIDR